MQAGLLASVLAFSPSGPAGPSSELQLRWDAPKTCPDDDRIRARVEQLLGRPLQPSDDPLRVTGRMVEGDGSWTLELLTETEHGRRQRTLRGESCDVLTEAAVFTIAVAIDPEVTFASAPQEPRPEKPDSEDVDEPTKRGQAATREPTQPPPEPSAQPPPDEPPDVEPRFRGAAAFHTAGSIGLMPRPGVGVGGVLALVLRRARVELHYDHHFEQREPIGTDQEVAVRLWTLGARGCGVPAWRMLEFPLCGGLHAGPMRGRGIGALADRRTTRVAYVGAAAFAGLTYVPVRWFGIGLGLELLVPITRPGFVLDDTGLVYRTGPVAGRGLVRIEVRFP